MSQQRRKCQRQTAGKKPSRPPKAADQMRQIHHAPPQPGQTAPHAARDHQATRPERISNQHNKINTSNICAAHAALIRGQSDRKEKHAHSLRRTPIIERAFNVAGPDAGGIFSKCHRCRSQTRRFAAHHYFEEELALRTTGFPEALGEPPNQACFVERQPPEARPNLPGNFIASFAMPALKEGEKMEKCWKPQRHHQENLAQTS
ncbi:hypothetical protein FB599_1305 [Herbaspirillum sp. SJZ130]|nr:hypothetical protein FB599_1305 [Herbaspirillum sp. SJZ130]TQK14365.1 hypothetical protein FB598_1737 [Herbaspirillum sp. SJZ106]TWC66619.1 hypothetical protein FB597_105205 [Herbaspirillum sp. SJZ099]